MKKNKTKIFMACHDAGGGAILASLYQRYRSLYRWTVRAKGPSAAFFKTCNRKAVLSSQSADLLLTGTSWGSDLEKKLWAAAKRKNIPSLALLDNWVNFKQRFNASVKPNRIGITDAWAMPVAIREGFPKQKLISCENPLWEMPQTKPSKTLKKILFVLKTSSAKFKAWGKSQGVAVYDSYQVTRAFTGMLQETGWKGTLRLRPHPSETKPEQFLKAAPASFKTELSPSGNTLDQDIAWADLVVSFESMGLVKAVAMGKKTLSFHPNPKIVSRFPFKEIPHISNTDQFKKILSQKISRSAFSNKIRAFNRKHRFPSAVSRALRAL